MKFLVTITVLNLVYCEELFSLMTNQGEVRGIRNCLIFNNKPFCYKEFRKIPYAKPPVADLRFKKPVPFGKWESILDATSFGPSCIQTPNPFIDKWLPNTHQSEDCLFLNIYTPDKILANEKKSVMVWVYGGGFQTGQGMLYNASHLSAVGDVIVVTINYRLGAFGFFSTGSKVAPGNYGLWDQKLAFEWVHSNIDSFGGNNMSITLFGQSAGALSLGLQSLHNGNKGLFHRVIFQSGVGNSAFSTKSDPQTQAIQLARYVKCPEELTDSTMECLRNIPAREINNATDKINEYTHSLDNVHIGIPFAPVIDHDFIKDKPVQLLRSSASSTDLFQSLDIMIGNAESEGSSLIITLFSRDDINVTNGIPSSYLCDRIIPAVTSDYYDNITIINDKICEKYSSEQSLQKQSELAMDYYGDLFFYSPSIESINIHSVQTGSKQFLYLNTRHAVDNPRGVEWFKEAAHGDELFYLFPSLISNATNDDIAFSLMLIKYWTNFAKTGYVILLFSFLLIL